jgi:hypothetical protein
MIKFFLRPHHALCIQFFVGNGYSAAFTKNMYETIAGLKTNPTLQVVSKADMLCAKCPNLQGEDCIHCDDSVAALDKAVMELCGFSDGDCLSAKEFFTTAREAIIDVGKMKDVCGNCSWRGICFQTELQEVLV